ncbi:MAG TPA: response regulator [Microvirga sp.]|nr:response regulator [Microvirga sp.]
MLTGLRVLICEDEPFIALDLTLCVQDAGGEVVGPAASVREALALIETHPVSAAILDVHLRDRDVTPVADLLLQRGVPVVIQTGVGLPDELRERYPALPVLSKPVLTEHIVRRLSDALPPVRSERGSYLRAPQG